MLDGVNFTVLPNTVCAVSGESGCGKSTLLNVICGLDHLTSGNIFLNNENICGRSESELAILRNCSVGFIFQTHNLLPEFTALENIILPALVYAPVFSNKIKSIRTRAEELLDRVGLLSRKNHYIGELSGGEMQRIAIARALINKPNIILADEPTGNLDEKNSAAVFNLLISIVRSEHCAMILVTHSKTLAQRCDRRFLLSNGVINSE